jgi:hypothetical protein
MNPMYFFLATAIAIALGVTLKNIIFDYIGVTLVAIGWFIMVRDWQLERHTK